MPLLAKIFFKLVTKRTGIGWWKFIEGKGNNKLSSTTFFFFYKKVHLKYQAREGETHQESYEFLDSL